jgi:2-methylcitrate dehydratase
MEKRYQNERIASFALGVNSAQIDPQIFDQLKRHLLDAIASMADAVNRPTIQKLARQIKTLSQGGDCDVPVIGNVPCDRAAQFYTALVRYPDLMDNYLGKEATCHPSDNIGSLLAVAQSQDSSGLDFLTALAVAYQVECRLVEEIPVMMEGIDHTLFLAYSITCGIARLLGLSEQQTTHALSMSGCTISPMVTSRASYTYEWKGIASSFDAKATVGMALLARENMTGPIALFEGPKGFAEIFNMKLDYDWEKENFSLIPKCCLKQYNAEVHSQSTIDALLLLRQEEQIDATEIARIEITTFLTAFHIIGGGAYGDRKTVESKEQADHSLFYLAAVAMLDGDIWPEQFEPERIRRADVQELLQKVEVKTSFPLHEPMKLAAAMDAYTRAYPKEMHAKVSVTLKNGKHFTKEVKDYPGFFTRPFSWKQTIDKFKRLAGHLSIIDREKIISTVRDIEKLSVRDLCEALNVLGN